MKILKAYKYRLYPTKFQQQLLAKHFGAARWIYNYGLERKIKEWEVNHKCVSYYEIKKELPKLKKQEETQWLSEVNAQSLQASLCDLDKAYTMFFKKKCRFPKFKSKHNSKQSFHVIQRLICKFKENKIIIPKFKEGIKCVFDRQFNGIVKFSTITKIATNKYFISVLVETNNNVLKKKKLNINKALGIDLGIHNFVTLSNGTKISNPKYLNISLKKLRRAQKYLSKKQKGSKNREKARLKVALIHEKILNQRSDFLHKLSRQLVNENQIDTFCFETLNVKDMQQNKYLSRSILDASWKAFINMMKYKCDWLGKNCLFIGQFEPSSKTCSCGKINTKLTLADRTWKCDFCGTEHDRDILAANNILKFAFNKQNLIGEDIAEFKLAENSDHKTESMTQEAIVV